MIFTTHKRLRDLFLHVPEQIGMKGEALSLHTVSGSSSVEWVEGSLLARKQPLTWYKVRTTSILNYHVPIALMDSNKRI
jgi:hypothetical protein